ncbi:LRR and PYD domains-containing 3-like protein [Labeo rohita]|uniref:LRR and PYD domains-containing 3-like protein n=1 Tax=Labeo rohita TaxID=84645 RepID=A0A498MA78_LABRO|nr:LRR and PYD domains-containing 3-like protein [Labeo rohita]
MVECFGREEAVKIMVGILRKINQNELAEQLENEHKQAQTKGITNTSVPVGADTDQTSNCPTCNLTAQSLWAFVIVLQSSNSA